MFTALIKKANRYESRGRLGIVIKYLAKLNVFLFLSMTTAWFVLPAVSFAAGGFGYKGYKIITSIPGTNIVAGQSIDGITIASYIATIYRGGLALVGFTAFVMIVYWGVMYTVSGGNTSKTSEAKTGITQAILGLILLLAGFLILNFINPALVNIQQIDNNLKDPNYVPNINIQDPGGNNSLNVHMECILGQCIQKAGAGPQACDSSCTAIGANGGGSGPCKISNCCGWASSAKICSDNGGTMVTTASCPDGLKQGITQCKSAAAVQAPTSVNSANANNKASYQCPGNATCWADSKSCTVACGAQCVPSALGACTAP
jgi:hypothetical protein